MLLIHKKLKFSPSTEIIQCCDIIVQLIDSWLAKLHLNNLKSPQVMDIIVYVECSCTFRKQDTAFCYLVGDVPELPFTLAKL